MPMNSRLHKCSAPNGVRIDESKDGKTNAKLKLLAGLLDRVGLPQEPVRRIEGSDDSRTRARWSNAKAST